MAKLKRINGMPFAQLDAKLERNFVHDLRFNQDDGKFSLMRRAFNEALIGVGGPGGASKRDIRRAMKKANAATKLKPKKGAEKADLKKAA